jgi:folate-binding Fe-S cluster repair protein YgfZ
MPEPPAFSESTKRKLRVQWDTLRDKHKLEDEDLSSYDQQRNRVARQWEELRGKHGYDQGRKALSQKARSI